MDDTLPAHVSSRVASCGDVKQTEVNNTLLSVDTNTKRRSHEAVISILQQGNIVGFVLSLRLMERRILVHGSLALNSDWSLDHDTECRCGYKRQ